MSATLTILPVRGIPQVRAGDDVGALVVTALRAQGEHLHDGDLLVVTSKLVSKAEHLVPAGVSAQDGHATTDPADRAALVLAESSRVVSERATSTGTTRVVAALAGPVMAGAGIDASNTGSSDLLLLPHDPDAAAAALRAAVVSAWGEPVRVGVVLSDTAGRPWRAGLTDFALGLAGVRGVDDLRGRTDSEGRELAVTVRCLADEVAAAADLVKGKLDGVPVAVVRGLDGLVVDGPGTGARELVRSGPDDWFALGRAEAVRDALGVPAGSPLSESCGIESVHPEPLADRIARAVRVALADPLGPGVGAASDGDRVELRADDPVLLGRAWARLEVALAGERLAGERLAGERLPDGADGPGPDGDGPARVVRLRVRER